MTVKLTLTKFKLFLYCAVLFGCAVYSNAINAQQYIPAEQIYKYAKQQNTTALRYAGYSIDSTDANGNTALCLALADGDSQAYHTLLKFGANPNPSCASYYGGATRGGMTRGGMARGGATSAGYSGSSFLGLSPTGWLIAAALVGGGVAIAAASGGGGSGGSDSNPCAGYQKECSTGYIPSSDTCKNGNTTYYKCIPNPCDGYVSSCADGYHMTGEQCRSGEKTMYKCAINECKGFYKTCPTGYEWSGKTCQSGETEVLLDCVVAECRGFNFDSKPENCETEQTCISGDTVKYKCNVCKTGWKGEDCNTPTGCGAGFKEQCDENEYIGSETCSSGGIDYKQCKPRSNTYKCTEFDAYADRCTACEENFMPDDNGYCITNAAACIATGYVPDPHCDAERQTTEDCPYNDAYHKCNCREGYIPTSDNRCVTPAEYCQINEYQAEECSEMQYISETCEQDPSYHKCEDYTEVPHCIAYNPTADECTSCEDDYTLHNGRCEQDIPICEGYTQEEVSCNYIRQYYKICSEDASYHKCEARTHTDDNCAEFEHYDIDDGLCKTCVTGYTTDDTGKCITNAEACTDADYAATCNYNTHWMDTGQTCPYDSAYHKCRERTYIDPNCDTYKQNANECAICVTGYAVDDTGRCVSNAEYCQIRGYQTEACIATQYIDSVCEKDSSYHHCDSRTHLDEHCVIYLHADVDDGKCQTCITDYHPNDDGVCVENQSPQERCLEAGYETRCDDYSTHWMDMSQTCPYDSSYHKCEPRQNTQYCQSYNDYADKCTSCTNIIGGFSQIVLEDGVCVYLECGWDFTQDPISCDNQTQYIQTCGDGSYHRCHIRTPIEGCLEYDPYAERCTVCDTEGGYELENGICIMLPPSQRCTDAGYAATCNYDTQWMDLSQTCSYDNNYHMCVNRTYIDTKCSVYEQNANRCAECITGYSPDASGVCVEDTPLCPGYTQEEISCDYKPNYYKVCDDDRSYHKCEPRTNIDEFCEVYANYNIDNGICQTCQTGYRPDSAGKCISDGNACEDAGYYTDCPDYNTQYMDMTKPCRFDTSYYKCVEREIIEHCAIYNHYADKCAQCITGYKVNSAGRCEEDIPVETEWRNSGDIVITESPQNQVYGMDNVLTDPDHTNYTELANTRTGTIHITGVTNTGGAYGMYIESGTDEHHNKAYNNNLIEITNNAAATYGMHGEANTDLFNGKDNPEHDNTPNPDAKIEITGNTNGISYGMHGYNMTNAAKIIMRNNGGNTINPTSPTATYGIYAINSGTAENKGLIDMSYNKGNVKGLYAHSPATGTELINGIENGYNDNIEIKLSNNEGTATGMEGHKVSNYAKITVSGNGTASNPKEIKGINAKRDGKNLGTIDISLSYGDGISGIWSTTNSAEYSLTNGSEDNNDALISISSNAANNTIGINGYNINNYGTISLTDNSGGQVYGMNGSNMTNSGTISLNNNINNKSNEPSYGMFMRYTGSTAENSGIIEITAQNSVSTYGIYGASGSTIINSGNLTIKDGTRGAVIGLYARENATLKNTGHINIRSNSGNAFGIEGNDKSTNIIVNGFSNTGDDIGDNSNVKIELYGNLGGINGNGSFGIRGRNISNYATIDVSGADGDLFGIYVNNGTADEPSQVLNAGTIKVTATTEAATGYGIWSAGPNVVINNTGTIIMNDTPCTGTACGSANNAIVANGATINTSGLMSAQSLDLAAVGGTVVALSGAKFEVENDLSGDLIMSSDIVTNGFNDTYMVENMIAAGDVSGLNLHSQSALFNATLENDSDAVLTRKAFDEVIENSSVADFLTANYAEGNNEALFNTLKAQKTTAALNTAVSSLFGADVFNRFNFEDMTMMRELNMDVNNKLFNDTSSHLTTSGSITPFYFDSGAGSNGRYALYNTRIGQKSLGMSLAFTNVSSRDRHDNNSRKDETFQLSVPFGYKTHGFKFITAPRFGYAYGTYDRNGYNRTYDGTVEKRMLGLTNEARYPVDMGGWSLAPAVEFNMLGYHIKGHEDAAPYALNIKSQNNYSIETGIGLYANKDLTFGKAQTLKMNAGIAAYHEFADPYTTELEMQGMSGSFKIRDERRKDNRLVLRTGFDYQFAEDFSLIGAISTFVDGTTHTNAGLDLKYRF